jgi:AcrR family transcriptional regulator
VSVWTQNHEKRGEEDILKEIKLDRKTRYTRKVLRDSLVELMMNKPITKITIKELCENADINRTTFYAHYRDQYDILQQVEEEILTCIENILDKYESTSGRRELGEMVGEIFNFIAGNSNSIQTLLGENGDLGFQKRLFRRFMRKEHVMKYFSSKSIPEETKDYWYVYLISGAIGLTQHWLKDDMSMPVPELAKMLIKLNP